MARRVQACRPHGPLTAGGLLLLRYTDRLLALAADAQVRLPGLPSPRQPAGCLTECWHGSVTIGCWPWPPPEGGHLRELLQLVCMLCQERVHVPMGREGNTRVIVRGKCCALHAARLKHTSCRLEIDACLACCLWQHADLCIVLPAWPDANVQHRGLCACQATIRDLKDVRTGALYIAASQTVGVYDMPRLVGVSQLHFLSPKCAHAPWLLIHASDLTPSSRCPAAVQIRDRALLSHISLLPEALAGNAYRAVRAGKVVPGAPSWQHRLLGSQRVI